jgi:hypothetical protein
MGEPNWIVTTLLGAIAGYLFPYLIKFLLFVARRFRRDIAEGIWHEYHITNREGTPYIEHYLWNIRKGLLNEYVIKETRPPLKEVIYQGTLSFERNFWLIKLRALKHKEEASIRLFSPITTADERTWGLFLALDFQGRAIAAPLVISKEEMTDTDVLKLFSDKVSVQSKTRVIFI